MNCITTISKDLINIVKCHKSAFPNALSSKMGTPFILKMMEWYVTSDRGILFHLENENNEIIGYCGGIITKQEGLHGAVTSISQYAFNTFIISYLIKPWLIFHPENIKKITYIKKNILLKFGLHKTVETINKEEFRPFIGLIVIGLKKENQGKGIGSILLNEFEKRAMNNNDIEKISLSVKPENLNAIKSYSKNGWKIGKQTKTSIQMYKLI
jgi:ribosomal protein S18 acetylase RimI-like enzyme